jgi:hypothetical protein
MAHHPIVGTWAFVASEWKRADGRHANPFGAGAMGVLMYDASGYMSAQIMQAGRAPVTNIAPTIDAAFGLAIPGFLAYAGSYAVDDALGVVTHSVIVSSFPPWVGSEHRRHFVIEGDVLTLRDELTTADGVAVAASTAWRRMTS